LCDICEFKKDVELLQVTTSILSTIDFERLMAYTELFAKLITLVDSFDEKPEILAFYANEIEVDQDNVAAMAMMDLYEIADAASAFYETCMVRAERTADAVTELLKRVALEEESENHPPPSAFTDFFKGGDDE
jgi:hypothetical protein